MVDGICGGIVWLRERGVSCGRIAWLYVRLAYVAFVLDNARRLKFSTKLRSWDVERNELAPVAGDCCAVTQADILTVQHLYSLFYPSHMLVFFWPPTKLSFNLNSYHTKTPIKTPSKHSPPTPQKWIPSRNLRSIRKKGRNSVYDEVDVKEYPPCVNVVATDTSAIEHGEHHIKSLSHQALTRSFLLIRSCTV